MILGAVTPKNKKDLRSSLHPNTIKPILDMGIDIIFESGLGAVSYTHLTLPTNQCV